MNRYFKLDTAWDTRPWIQALSSEAQNVWIKLQCYVAAHGLGGKANALTPAYAARIWWVGEESVKQCLTAAGLAGELDIDGESWVLVNWSEQQGDTKAKERMRAYRKRLKDGAVEPEKDDRYGALRNVTHKKKKREEEEEENPPKPPKGIKPPAALPPIPPDLYPIKTALENFIEHRKEIKKPMTGRALEIVFGKCRKWGFARSLQSIEDSIQAGYQGLFEPRKVSDIVAPQLSREERRRLTS